MDKGTLISFVCVIAGCGILTRYIFGPCLIAWRRAKNADLVGRAKALRRTNMSETPYRDTKEARIRSLESRNRSLEDEVREKEQKLGEAQDLIKQLWYRVHEAERRSIEPPATFITRVGSARIATTLCLFLAAGFVMGGISAIPSNTGMSRALPLPSSARERPSPTMIDLPDFTSGGEMPVAVPPREYYVVVLVTMPSYAVGGCYEGELLLVQSHATLDLITDDGHLVHVVWLIAFHEPARPLLHLRL